MLSSVTTIINAISYILIAFVSISLIVSSIMIGIITYILWIVYDLYCASYANVLAESIVVISNLIILLKTKNSENKKIILSRR